jgi:hypothetical protein
MAELKTKPTDASVEAFLGRTAEGERKRDCFAVLKMMQQVTKAKPRMWGASIVGFGSWQYKSGAQEADWPVVAFSPRKQNLTLYLMPGFERFGPLMKKLGTYKTGKSCLYLKRLSDVDPKVLKELVGESVRQMKTMYPTKF